jgi:hypothetical protein
MDWKRLAPLTGVLFVALLIASFLVSGETPDADASAQEAVSFYTSNDTSVTVSAALGGLGVVAFLFFLGILRGELRRYEAEPGVLSATAFAGGILVAVGGAAFSAFALTLSDTADKLDPSAVQALNALNEDFFVPLAAGSLVLLLAAGIAAVRTRAFPKWLGWAAIVIAIAWVTPAFFIAGPGALLWIVIVSVMLSQRAAATTTPAPAAPARPPA